jgi:hypothetical protein
MEIGAAVTTLRLEHAISDFDLWKSAFDRDPIGREQLGVRAHRVFRPLDDPNYVAVDLEFDSPAEAERCMAALGELWRSKQAAPALRGAPQVPIVETVERVQYRGAGRLTA